MTAKAIRIEPSAPIGEGPKPANDTADERLKTRAQRLGPVSGPDEMRSLRRKLLQTESRLSKLEALLEFEDAVRKCRTFRELVYCIANKPLDLVESRQILIFRARGFRSDKVKLDAVSSLSSVDANAPKVRALEDALGKVLKVAMQREETVVGQPLAFGRHEDSSALAGTLVPLLDDRKLPFAALVFVSANNKVSEAQPIHALVGDVARHAWLKLQPRRRATGSIRLPRYLSAVLAVASIIVMFIPVSLTALAPVEIVARDAQVVAAPIDGIIEEILVEPNSIVSKGKPLFRFVDTTLASNRDIANEKKLVAIARLNTAQQNSFGNGEGKRDLAIAEAELQLALRELAYAESQLAKAVVASSRDGVAVFDRKSDWQGRPIAVGERVLEIADPRSVEAEMFLPVSDAIVLHKDAEVRLFLDSSPLSAIPATVKSASYRAVPHEGKEASYRVVARISGEEDALLRIGTRGTAQVFGETTTLGFFLFRKPLAYIRQWIGW
ncbi:efflux RND transporter periplasmic adaptor subunit [Pseudahrensia aquimaris]|uniref:Efflux RND transporter periplasmic adaptor subunit n=1 Tax=Pseudahrensia aquimaris TaxID=744461 RepID=A0ABW3FGI6_9HYPH